MTRPQNIAAAVQMLCIEQETLSVEAHTHMFIDLACLTNFPDHSLCTFYLASLNAETKARLPGVGPRGDFAEFVEWVLVSCNSPYTISLGEDKLTSPTATPAMPEPALDDWLIDFWTDPARPASCDVSCPCPESSPSLESGDGSSP